MQKKSLCFSCLTEEVSDAGGLPTFNIKQKPVHANCAVCDAETTGPDLAPSPWGFICRQCCDLCETQTGVQWDLIKISSQKEWLVKANGRILGPFSAEEIESRLRENRVVPVDEISRPLGRWILIRDEDRFRPIVNELKNRQTAKSDGESTDVGTLAGDDNQTVPIDVSVDRPFIKTEELLKGIEPKVREVRPVGDPTPSRDIVKNYASPQDPKIIPQIRLSKSRQCWWALGVLVVSLIVASVKITSNKDGLGETGGRTFQDIMNQAISTEKIGDYRRAIDLFNEARRIKSRDAELLLHLAPLTLGVEGQTLSAQKMFVEMMEIDKGANYQKAGLVGLGLIAMTDHQYEQAVEKFESALRLDPEYGQAIFNLGVTKLLMMQPAEALTLLRKAANRLPNEGSIIVTQAEAVFSHFETNSLGQKSEKEIKDYKAELNVLMGSVKNYLANYRDYTHEVLLTGARIAVAQHLIYKAEGTSMGTKLASDSLESVVRYLGEFFDTDPERTSLHTKDWLLYADRASWGVLLPVAKRITQDVNIKNFADALVGLGLYFSRERTEGIRSIEAALQQNETDSALLALTAWTEYKSGKKDVAFTRVQMALRGGRPLKFPHLLQAKICFADGDLECAQDHFAQMLAMDPESIEALHGIAEVQQKKKNPDQALDFLKKALGVDPYYIPLLKLKQEIWSQ
ncbi:MAG: tetratricopeptide repeat protein [Oligoflexia bacterium]|nr:tetratricopeptide repeat protein [Oligoflexia bacterium]